MLTNVKKSKQNKSSLKLYIYDDVSEWVHLNKPVTWIMVKTFAKAAIITI